MNGFTAAAAGTERNCVVKATAITRRPTAERQIAIAPDYWPE
jgi:hypothetical protein